MTSSSNNPSASGEHKIKRVCKICYVHCHLAQNCCNKTISNKQIYIVGLIDYDCFANDVLPPCWEWTLNSAFTAHVCQNKAFFISLQTPSQASIVRMHTTLHAVKGICECSFRINERGRVNTINSSNPLYTKHSSKSNFSVQNG